MSEASLHVTWSDGTSRATIIVLDGERISLLTARAFAPGSRPEGVLGDGAPLRLKTARCRLASEAERSVPTASWAAEAAQVFLLEGRLLDASRALRTTLEGALSSVSHPPTSEPEPSP